MLARMDVLLHDARRVGEGHVPPGKAAEARTGGNMEVFERKM